MAKKINPKRSKAMREAWARRKATKLNGEMMPMGNVLEAVQASTKLVELFDGNKGMAIAMIKRDKTTERLDAD